ncbi:MAG: 6-phosphogluconolactonase [Verrucomicrobiota bacterium]
MPISTIVNQIFPDSDALTEAAAEQFVALAKAAVAERGAFLVALSGGSTPKRLYSLLASDPTGKYDAPWDRVQFFFGDERHVPPDDAESNYRMAKEAMFDLIKPPAENIHRVLAETDAAEAAQLYEDTMREVCAKYGCVEGGFPRMDLTLLGMGSDGHTASLFPESKGLEEKQRWVIANWVEKFDTWRITMTYPAINQSAQISLFIAGDGKADMIREVRQDFLQKPKYPVQGVIPANGTKTWMLDEAAAAKLDPEFR